MKRGVVSMMSMCVLFVGMIRVSSVHAQEVLGVHLLHPSEITQAKELLRTEENKDQWMYITIPFVLEDLNRLREWQQFFSLAREYRFKPIIRLGTRYNPETQSWDRPTRKDIVNLVGGIDHLEWPDESDKIVVIFNEPNHAKEWGGKIDAVGYARTLQFAIDWLVTTDQAYRVLPAGLDLAASNGRDVTTNLPTAEALEYLRTMLQAEPRIAETIGGWNSHSYPNPGFSGRPTDTGKLSLRGWESELLVLKEFSTRDIGVYITETGWEENNTTRRWIKGYYAYAVDHVWSDPRIQAVTPFVLNGSPGPFERLSFFDASGKPTLSFDAFRQALIE